MKLAPVLAMSLLACAVPALAAGTHTLSVGATVLSAGTCKFDTAGPTALAFGAVDPTLGNASATATIGYRCTGGGASPNLTWAVGSDDGIYETGPGLPRMRHATNLAQFIRYSLDIPLSGTVPKNTSQTLTVNGTILATDMENALPGNFADTVVLTMSP